MPNPRHRIPLPAPRARTIGACVFAVVPTAARASFERIPGSNRYPKATNQDTSGEAEHRAGNGNPLIPIDFCITAFPVSEYFAKEQKSFSKSVRAALHRLAFGDGNNEWRRLVVDSRGLSHGLSHGFWRVPHSLVSEESIQRRTFHAITGGWMGKDRRRGFPYTWIPNHLGDTEGKVSPRSFIAALKSAAENTMEQHPDHGNALHYDSIEQGVRRASGIRVAELKEDYPWVDRLLKSLHGMATPCDFADVAERWAERDVLDRLRDEVEFMDVKLPPSRIEEGPDGVRQDLESLHVFLRMHDGRVNVPDVFRIGYGLGRRGGVRPVGPVVR